MAWGKRSVKPLTEEEALTLTPLDQEELEPVTVETVDSFVSASSAKEEQQYTYSGPFVTEDGVRELVLYTSLLLRTPDLMPNLEQPIEVRPSWGTLMYMRNDIHRTLEPLIPNILRMYDFITNSNYVTDTLLPDVCGVCFTSFGLTVSCRIRRQCCRCMYTGTTEHSLAVSRYWNMERILQMIGNNFFLLEMIWSQLIYKYYSPNGDKTWQLILPKLQH